MKLFGRTLELLSLGFFVIGVGSAMFALEAYELGRAAYRHFRSFRAMRDVIPVA